MNRCLQIPEIVRHICGELYVGSALPTALAGKAFLEPALDRLWHEIDSFAPLVACLPEDLFTASENPCRGRSTPYKILYLRRAPTLSDLRRFVDFYARRIRSFWVDTDSETWISVEALQSFQIVTNWVPGVLSPRLETFVWTTPRMMQDILGADMANIYPLCMSLFFGPTVTDVDVGVDTQHLLYSTLMHSYTTALHPRLKALEITDYEENGRDPKKMPFIHDYITSGLWAQLETLKFPGEVASPYLASSTLSHIASLPRLVTLELTNYMDQPSLEHPNNTQTPQFGGLPDGAFPSLRHLKLSCNTLSGIVKVLQHLPSTNKVANLECSADEEPAPHDGTQRAIDIIARHFDLKELELRVHLPGNALPDLPLELDDNDGLDITPLLVFNKLAKLDLQVCTPIRPVTPGLLQKFPTAWPRIEHLNIFTARTTTQVPFIDHTHLLSLLESCPTLTFLGLRFDASCITGDELSPSAPFHLKTLVVGDSPISSPSRVVSFLKSNVPSCGYPRHLTLPRNGALLEWCVPSFRLRWQAVSASMGRPKNSRDIPWYGPSF